MGFRIMEIGHGHAQPVESVDEGEVAPPDEGTIRWIDLVAQDEASLLLLQERFDFHPLTIEDCRHFDQRPKLEEYSNYLFIVMHGFRQKSDEKLDLEPVEVHAFLGPRYLVTVHTDELVTLDATWKRVLGDPGLGRRGPDFVYYQVVDAIVDANFALLDDVSDALDDIEDAVLNRADRKDLERIFHLKKTLVLLRRILSPQRDVFAMLAKRGHSCVKETTSLYFRDIYDHLTRIYESIDAGRDMLGSALDAYLSMVAQRTNDVMKRLTILSAVFLPLTFVTGFFGQNFTGLPMSSNALMWGVIALTVILPPAMLYLFKRSGWL